MNDNPDEVMIDAGEVARRLGMSRKAVMHLVARGKLPCIRISEKIIRFYWSEVQKAFRRQEVRTP